MKKKAGSKNLLKPRAPFKRVYIDITPAAAPKRLTSETTISNYLVILNVY